MRELAFTSVTPLQLVGPQHLGPKAKQAAKLDCSGFRARVHEAPVAHSLRDAFKVLGEDVRSEWYKAFDIWIVPHRLSIIRHSGLAEVVTVGCQVEYLAQGRTLSIVSLLPASDFIQLAAGGVEAQFAMAADISEIGEALPPGSEGTRSEKTLQLGPLELALSGKAQLGLSFSASVCTPYIAAVGVGSDACEFQFRLHREPLYNRDIETWALVAVSKHTKEIEYRIRYYFSCRLLFVPMRCSSDWVTVKCARGN
jgi:hypothetical protein